MSLVKFSAPLILKITTDGNELVFISHKAGVYTYRYTKSKTKLGDFLPLNEETLIKLIKNNK